MMLAYLKICHIYPQQHALFPAIIRKLQLLPVVSSGLSDYQ